jgi:uncharacterized membrane protein YjjP (DUF1212 family)
MVTLDLKLSLHKNLSHLSFTNSDNTSGDGVSICFSFSFGSFMFLSSGGFIAVLTSIFDGLFVDFLRSESSVSGLFFSGPVV